MKLLKLTGLIAVVSIGILAPSQASAAAPTQETAPVVSGTATIGQTLTTTNGTWTGTPTSFTYKWFRCTTGDPFPTGCTEITGANSTNSTYALKTSPTPANSDQGKFIRSQVTAVNGDGSTAGSSNSVGPVNSGTVPASTLSLSPKSGSFFNNAFKTADLTVTTGASAPNPPITELLPTRSTTLNLPPASQMTFNPGSMPVCPDNQIGPATNNSVEIPVIVARCPNAVIGNGTATFLLNRVNNPNATPPSLDGQIIVFNGGLNGGQPRLKFWAYSYDTGVAIYTEGTISTQGVLEIPIPQLTQDSAVNSLNFNLPGETITQYLPAQDITITIPGGQKADYVQSKCDTGTFPFSADFLLGRRLTDGTPIGNGEIYTDVGSDISCTGVPAVARLGKVTVTGPGTAKVGKVATYSVKITNTGGAAASGVRLAVSGRGVKINTSVGSIAGGGSKTVKIKAKFKSKGKIKATFKASSSNGGSASATKTVTVK